MDTAGLSSSDRNVMMPDPEQAVKLLRKLKAIGCGSRSTTLEPAIRPSLT